jgi:hypothetical protein
MGRPIWSLQARPELLTKGDEKRLTQDVGNVCVDFVRLKHVRVKRESLEGDARGWLMRILLDEGL